MRTQPLSCTWEVWSLRATRAVPLCRPSLQLGRCNHRVTILAPLPHKRKGYSFSLSTPSSNHHHPPIICAPSFCSPCAFLFRSSFPTSPTSRSPRELHENALHFGANGPTASPHISQGAAAAAASIQPFNSPSDIWHSHSAGVSVSSSPVTPTATSAAAAILGEKGNNSKGVLRRSPSESTRVNSRYDPVGGRPPPRRSAGPASESLSLTDEGEEERDSDGSVRDVRDKKRRYAKTFRDTEKHLFEKLRHRLFPQDPHAKRSECLERGAGRFLFFFLPSHRIFPIIETLFL